MSPVERCSWAHSSFPTVAQNINKKQAYFDPGVKQRYAVVILIVIMHSDFARGLAWFVALKI